MATNRKPVSIPVVGTDIDVGRVALVMNLIAANAAMPHTSSVTFWLDDYPDAEIALRAFAAANPKAYEVRDRRDQGNGLYLTRVADCACVATLYNGNCMAETHEVSP